MRRRSMRLVGLVLVVAACNTDPDLKIVVELPKDATFHPMIAKTEVSIYEQDGLTCEQVEFADITETQLLGALVAKQLVQKTGPKIGALDNISRVDNKVIVGRLYSEDDVLVAAGCAEQGELTEDTSVTVPTFIAATVVFDSLDNPSRDDPYGKLVTVLDPRGDSLVGRPVRWRLFGPSGVEPDSLANVTKLEPPNVWQSTKPSCTGPQGTVDMHPMPPLEVGGFAARFRVSWPSTQPELYSGFVRPHVALAPLGAVAAIGNRCAVRITATERRLVCLAGNTATRYELRLSAGTGNWNLVAMGTTANAGASIGLLSIDEGPNKEVYGITAAGDWVQLFGSTTPRASTCINCTIDDFRVLPGCGKTAKLLLHSTTGTPIRQMDLLGGPATDFRISFDQGQGVDHRLNNTGCMTKIDSQGNTALLQVTVVNYAAGTGGASTRAAFDCNLVPNSQCSVALPFPDSGVGFIVTGTVDAPIHQMVGASFDIDGAELISWILRPSGDTAHLIEMLHIEAAGPPSHLLVGKFDADAEFDLLWALRGNQARSVVFQASYGITVDTGQRLAALAEVNLSLDQMQVADLNGDGFDDIIGAGTNLLGTNVAIVIPTNVAGPDAPMFTDTTCN